jgi:hypothetical protein
MINSIKIVLVFILSCIGISLKSQIIDFSKVDNTLFANFANPIRIIGDTTSQNLFLSLNNDRKYNFNGQTIFIAPKKTGICSIALYNIVDLDTQLLVCRKYNAKELPVPIFSPWSLKNRDTLSYSMLIDTFNFRTIYDFNFDIRFLSCELYIKRKRKIKFITTIDAKFNNKLKINYKFKTKDELLFLNIKYKIEHGVYYLDPVTVYLIDN